MEKFIQQAGFSDADILAFIISQANKEIADQYGLTLKNSPKHPSFYTKDRVLSDMERGEVYFLCQKGGANIGCVAFEQPQPGSSYLNRLAVLPEYRHKGVGEKLVKHVLEHSISKNIKTVSIGIIAKHTVLKNWYLKFGFIEGETKMFDHLPFEVTFMTYEL
jgi:N-acetylglutamate synthase-like GNAT family acetyltransferase